MTSDIFGKRDALIVFGWVVAGHQLGAAFAALLAGLLCIAVALLVLQINWGRPIVAAMNT